MGLASMALYTTRTENNPGEYCRWERFSWLWSQLKMLPWDLSYNRNVPMYLQGRYDNGAEW